MRLQSASGVHLVVVVLLMVDHNSAAAESDIASDLTLFCKICHFWGTPQLLRMKICNQKWDFPVKQPTAAPLSHTKRQCEES